MQVPGEHVEKMKSCPFGPKSSPTPSMRSWLRHDPRLSGRMPHRRHRDWRQVTLGLEPVHHRLAEFDEAIAERHATKNREHQAEHQRPETARARVRGSPPAANNGHEISPAHTAPRRREVIMVCRVVRLIVVLLFRATKRTAIMQPLRDSCGSLAHKDLTDVAG